MSAQPRAAKTKTRPPSVRAGSTKKTPGAAGSSVMDEAAIRSMPGSEYMNTAQLEYFKGVLIEMKAEILARQSDAREQLSENESFADPVDRATAEEERVLAMRLRERESFLVRKIDESLVRIRDRSYGYCEKTGDAIGIPRLLARPTASVCVQVKEGDERHEVHFKSR